ncbi:MAG: S8 family serine peptidase [Anaerostipes hadrus]
MSLKGTSMATPHMAATAAMVKLKHHVTTSGESMQHS